MKKIVFLIAAVILVSAAMPVTAFAHGHGGAVKAQYGLCAVENCNTAGLHYHNNVCYSGHYVGDGHDYHAVCSVQGCTLSGVHEHDGVASFAHYYGDGHGYHNYGGRGKGYHH